MSWRVRDPRTLAHRWPLQGHYDDVVRLQHGTPVNGPTWAVNQFLKQCMELDGLTQHVNLGDVVALNAVSAFSLCFWMNQDVIDTTDYIFRKYLDGTNSVFIYTSAADGRMHLIVDNAGNREGTFDYSAVISANNWNHVAMVFDGSQADNASRLVCYVDGLPITLAFVGAIPAVTADLTGYDATLGGTANSFDGKLSDFRLYSAALSRDEVNTLIHSPRPTY